MGERRGGRRGERDGRRERGGKEGREYQPAAITKLAKKKSKKK